MGDLTREDIGFILESLSFTEQRFREYRHYPSYDFQRQQVERVQTIKRKVRALRRNATPKEE